MLNRILSIVLVSHFLVGGLASFAQAQSENQNRAEEIQQMLEERDREIKDLLGDKETFTEKQRERLKTVINDVIDFKAMAQQALGSHWSDLSAEQQAEFVDVFSEIVRAQSLSDLDVYRSTVTYEQIDVTGDSAHVVTSTVYKDVPTKVEYILGYKDETWRVHDIILDDVSTAEGYARSFQTVIRKRGFDALMKSLHKKLDKINAQ